MTLINKSHSTISISTRHPIFRVLSVVLITLWFLLQYIGYAFSSPNKGLPTKLRFGMSEKEVRKVAAKKSLTLKLKDTHLDMKVLVFKGGFFNWARKPDLSGVFLYDDRSFAVWNVWSGCTILIKLRRQLEKKYGKFIKTDRHNWVYPGFPTRI